MSVGIHVPSTSVAPLDSGEAYAEFFRQVEALGLDAVWDYGPRFDVDQHAIFGPPAEVAARLVEHVQAGVTKLMLGVPSRDLAHLSRVAREVAPLVRAHAAIAR